MKSNRPVSHPYRPQRLCVPLLSIAGPLLVAGAVRPTELSVERLNDGQPIDGSVSYTCRGTLCPGAGSVEAYLQRPWVMNDPHAFGPAVLALVQAHRIGMVQIVTE